MENGRRWGHVKSRVQLTRAHGELPALLHATATRWEPNVKIAALFFPDSHVVVLPHRRAQTLWLPSDALPSPVP